MVEIANKDPTNLSSGDETGYSDSEDNDHKQRNRRSTSRSQNSTATRKTSRRQGKGRGKKKEGGEKSFSIPIDRINDALSDPKL